MDVSQKQILERLEPVISRWREEVGQSHKLLTSQLTEANEQLKHLLDVLTSRARHAVLLASAQEEIEVLRSQLNIDGTTESSSIYPVTESLALESLRTEIRGALDRLSQTVSRWTDEVSGAHENLAFRIQEGSELINDLVVLIEREDKEKNQLLENQHANFHDHSSLLEEKEALEEKCKQLENSLLEMNSKRTDRATFESQLAMRDKELVQLQARQKELEQKRALLEAELVWQEEERDALKKALAVESQKGPDPELEASFQRLQRDERQHKQALETARQDIAALRTALEEAERELAGLKKAYASLETTHSETQELLNGAITERTALNNSLEESEQRCTGLISENNILLQNANKYEVEINELQQQIEAFAMLQEQLELFEQQNRTLQEKIDGLVKSESDAVEMTKELEKELATVQQNKQEIVEEYEEELQTYQLQFKDERSTLQSKVDTLLQESAEHNALLLDLQSQIEERDRLIQSSNHDQEMLRDTIRNLKSTLERAEQRENSLRTEINTLNSELESALKEAIKLRELSQHLENTQTKAQKDYETLQLELDKLNETQAKQVQYFEQTIQALQDENSALKDTLILVEEKDTASEFDDELSTLSKENETLRNQLSEKTAKITALEAQTRYLKEGFKQFETELAEARAENERLRLTNFTPDSITLHPPSGNGSPDVANHTDKTTPVSAINESGATLPHMPNVDPSSFPSKNEAPPLGNLLLTAGIISKEQLQNALEMQDKHSNRLLGEILRTEGYASEESIAQALAYQLDLPLVTPTPINVDKQVLDMLSREECSSMWCIPMRMSGDKLVVAMVNPLDTALIKALRIGLNIDISPAVTTTTDILNAIDALYGNDPSAREDRT